MKHLHPQYHFLLLLDRSIRLQHRLRSLRSRRCHRRRHRYLLNLQRRRSGILLLNNCNTMDKQPIHLSCLSERNNFADFLDLQHVKRYHHGI